MQYISRSIEPLIFEASRKFPVVVITGPRQTGKSTLLKKLFPRHRYFTFDDPVTLNRVRRDPAGFLDEAGSHVILDEIQYCPGLLPHIKMKVDAHRRIAGRFLLTGSQVFNVMQGMTESLAGRAAIYELLGFSWEELPPAPHTTSALFKRIYAGFYPDPAVHGVDPATFYGSYLKTYLERDLRQISNIRDLGVFQDFLELLAARAGGLLNLTEVSKECGVSYLTAKSWLGMLENTRVVYLLRPYHRNISKRVIKSPKLFFTDTGLLANLLRCPDAASINTTPLAGPLFENMVVIEFLKAIFNHGSRAGLYFFRDSNQNEVDLVIDQGVRKLLLEIKMTRSPNPRHCAALHKVSVQFPAAEKYLITAHEDPFTVDAGVKNLHWQFCHSLIRQ